MLGRPKLDISVLHASGEGPSKREAKHKAAEAMIYVLLPEVTGCLCLCLETLVDYSLSVDIQGDVGMRVVMCVQCWTWLCNGSLKSSILDARQNVEEPFKSMSSTVYNVCTYVLMFLRICVFVYVYMH